MTDHELQLKAVALRRVVKPLKIETVGNLAGLRGLPS